MRTDWCRHVLAAVLLIFVGSAVAGAQDRDFVPVTDAMLEDPAASDWLTWRRTPNGWGYSPLDQINRDNVGDLEMVWTRGLASGNQEAMPLAPRSAKAAWVRSTRPTTRGWTARWRSRSCLTPSRLTLTAWRPGCSPAAIKGRGHETSLSGSSWVGALARR